MWLLSSILPLQVANAKLTVRLVLLGPPVADIDPYQEQYPMTSFEKDKFLLRNGCI